MHIFAGKYKYRKLLLSKKLPFHPIVSAIRENIFNILGNYLIWNEVSVCDLFAGSGVLGLEALSRGARFVCFNDVNSRCVQLIRDNTTRLQISNAKVVCATYQQFLLQRSIQNQCFDLLFLDPPFVKMHFIFQAINLLLHKQLLNDQAIVVVHSKESLTWKQYNNFIVLKTKIYGVHYLYFLKFHKQMTDCKLNLKQSKLLILSGPSGVGKTAIVQTLLTNKDLNLTYSVSITTRAPRIDEQDGVDYHFFSPAAFEKAIARNDFIEYAKYLNHYYGTSQTYVQNLLDQDKNVLFETELEGAINIKKRFPQAVWIFLFPPSLAELRSRIEKRGTEISAEINQRVKKAEQEMHQIRTENLSDLCLINNDQQQTINAIIKFVKKEWVKI